MPVPDTALVVMARHPERGKVKTRLAESVGEDVALRLYRAFLSDLVRRFSGSAYHVHWAIAPAEVNYMNFINAIDVWPESVFDGMCGFPQGLGDLGARMLSAFQRTHESAYRYTILIGSDLPQLSLRTIQHAREKLDQADVVLGPAEDGGYYLVGMCEPHDVFTGISMSTSTVRRETIELVQRQGLRLEFVEPHFDVDELRDLLRLKKILTRAPELAPVTAAELAELELPDITESA